jgi:citrate synthase
MRWLTADDAAAEMGVRPQTLYAYVSRGRIRSQADPADPRRSLYAAADIAGLTQRKARGRKAADVAADAIAWGEPVLESAITTVVEGRLYYRGHEAVRLAETETFEGVARILRGLDAPPQQSRLRPAPPDLGDRRARLFAALAARAARDDAARGRSPTAVAAEGATLLDVVADAVCGAVDSGPIHERLAQAWSCGGRGADLIRRCLVLLADHELNASTFAARVAASTGAGLAACVLAGLAALTGPLHGGASLAVAQLAAEAERLARRKRSPRASPTGPRPPASAIPSIRTAIRGRGRCWGPLRRRNPIFG